MVVGLSAQLQERWELSMGQVLRFEAGVASGSGSGAGTSETTSSVTTTAERDIDVSAKGSSIERVVPVTAVGTVAVGIVVVDTSMSDKSLLTTINTR